ncbi:MAG TPA: ribonuclease P protein component [Bacteroidetes bacterium]|nr:ribonuclease P protein component [Bacteroidota bacterium]
MKRHGLDKRRILRSKAAIAALFQDGKVIRCPYFDVFYLPSDKPEVLFAASRQFKTAVDRNRAKRRMREVYRLSSVREHRLRISIIAKPPALSAPFDKVIRKFDDVLLAIPSAKKHD